MSATSMVTGIERGSTHPAATRGPEAARVQTGRPAAAAAGAATPLRLTRRGRLVVTLVMTCLIVAAFVVFGGASVATRDGGAAESVRIIEVEQGQTLWQIAATVAGPGETGEMVYRIRELNSLPGSGLVEGQELAVPLS